MAVKTVIHYGDIVSLFVIIMNFQEGIKKGWFFH